ncbi:hypothetical protein AX17_000590 [Amanita inopinata Kibby_2008]|nr:hypothetical protein AX17_000590 [Amanita inopinata Kibby_2008]
MHVLAGLSLLVLANLVFGHEEHHHDGPANGETIELYAQRHMSSEHHIDTFDTGSFFQLHDLNRDGVWDKDEIEAIYGVHHVYSQKKSKDEIEQQKKADFVVEEMLKTFDLDKDGKITKKELERISLNKLPNFDRLGAEGHHYDVESEFFLHHEEKYHSTPETQTDESYDHPEDVEHFAHHEDIERKEAEREAKFQGVSVEEVLKYQGQPSIPIPGENDAQTPIAPPKPKYTRVIPPEKQDPSIKYKNVEEEAKKKDAWGAGDAGYMVPRDAGDKMRRNLPYKYKFRRNWGDF